MLFVVCFQSYTDVDIRCLYLYLHIQQCCRINAHNNSLGVSSAIIKRTDQPEINLMSYVQLVIPKTVVVHVELERLSTARQKQDGGVVPWREDHGRRPIPEGLVGE